MHKALRLLVWLSVATSAFAGFDFKGDALGMPLTEFVQKYERVTADAGRKAPNIILENKRTDPLAYRRYGMISVQKYFGFEEREQAKDTVAGVPARVTYNFFAESLADWDAATAPRRELDDARDKLVDAPLSEKVKLLNARAWTPEEKAAADRVALGLISIYFDKTAFNRVVDALKEKYGAPTSESTEALQNRMGASFPCRVVKWISDEDKIVVKEMSHDINTSSMEISRPSVMMRGKKAAESVTKAAAKDL